MQAIFVLRIFDLIEITSKFIRINTEIGVLDLSSLTSQIESILIMHIMSATTSYAKIRNRRVESKTKFKYY